MERLGRLIRWVRVGPLLAVVLWGGIYPGARLGLREIPVLSFTYLRIILATAVLFAVSGRAPQLILSRHLWKQLVRAGLAQTAFQALLLAGLARIPAGTSAILLATAPLMTAGWLALGGRERHAGRQWVGLVLGLGGVALVVRGGELGLDWPHLSGSVLGLGAAGAWAWYSLAIGPLVGSVGTLRATAWAMAVAALLLTPVSFAEAAHLWGKSISWPAWAGLVYGATAGMVVAMALWGRSVHTLGPRQTMIYAYLEPVSAVVIAALLLGESLRPMQAVGVLLIFAGVWLASD